MLELDDELVAEAELVRVLELVEELRDERVTVAASCECN